MTEKILCVDDEPSVLDAFKRQLRKQFTIETALSGQAGLEMIATQGPYAVVVSDMRMSEMDGVQFLSHVKHQAPDAVRVMLTGNADQQTAIEAINQGSIFRFLNKPCSPENLTETLTDALGQYRLITAEKELLEKTLRGSIKVLTDVLSLVSPTAFGRAMRAQALVRKICSHMKVQKAWQYEIAAMLSQIGLVTLPPDVIDKVYHGKTLTEEESQMVEAHPAVGRDLVKNIPRLQTIAEFIAYQNKRFDGGGSPMDQTAGEEIPLGGRILKAALDLDTLLSNDMFMAEAMVNLKKRTGWYDPKVLDAIEASIDSGASFEEKEVKLSKLTNRMILAQDIVTTGGVLVISKGQEVSRSLIERLKNFSRSSQIQEPIRVYIQVEEKTAMTDDHTTSPIIQ